MNVCLNFLNFWGTKTVSFLGIEPIPFFKPGMIKDLVPNNKI